jgi:hypothetical protein
MSCFKENIKAQALKDQKVRLYSFFNLGARCELTPRPGRFITGKEKWHPLYRRLRGSQDQSGRV